MILSKSEILKNIANQSIIADGILPQMIKDQSIDCSLYNICWKWSNATNKFIKIDITEKYLFIPGDFILGIIDEWVGATKNSNICCEWRLKSTSARHGIDNALAMWIETGYFSRLCTEFFFHKPVYLKAGDLIGQFIFHKTIGDKENYAIKGSYQNTDSLEELKNNWKPENVLPKQIKNKNLL